MYDYAHPNDRLQWLLRQIAAGWQVEAPVLERAVAQRGNDRSSTFEFVLRNEGGYQAIVVQDCPELRLFLQERGLQCIAI